MPSPIRLDATSYTIEGLLARARAGEIRVPGFQRNFRWQRDDVERLIDSVHRSFPIGTLLLWKRRGAAERLNVGDLSFDVPSSEAVLWVVDGQQRLTSLVNVLLTDMPGPRFDLGWNVHQGHLSRTNEATLPLAVAVDSERLVDWLSTRVLSAEARRAAIHLGTSLREYRVPVWTIETEDETSIREIFGRLNSLGKKLKPHEIFEALEQSPASSLATTAKRVSAMGFGSVSAKLIHQTIRAFQGEDFTRDRVGRVNDSSVFAAVEQGLSNAIVLLREADIPHVKLLPYAYTLVLLGAFFARHPTPSPRNRELLRRWVWRASASGQGSGADLAWLRSNIAAIALAENEGVQAMVRATLRSSPTEWDIRAKRFDLRSGRTRIEALAMLALSTPPLSPDEIARAQEARQLEFREELAGRRMATSIRRMGIAFDNTLGLESLGNRTVVVNGQEQALRRVSAFNVLAPDGSLEKNLQTLKERTAELNAWLPIFIETHARTLADDRGPLDALILEDEVVDAT